MIYRPHSFPRSPSSQTSSSTTTRNAASNVAMKMMRLGFVAALLSTTTTTSSSQSSGWGVDAAPAGASSGGDTSQVPRGSSSVFLSGDLGSVTTTTTNGNNLLALIQQDPNEVKAAAGDALHALLQEHAGFSGQETIVPVPSQPIHVDKQRRAHLRFRQYVDGLPLEGATIALHVDVRTGQVLAANGNVHSTVDLVNNINQSTTPQLECETAMEMALLEHLAQRSITSVDDIVDAEWKDECQWAAVQGRDGTPYLAYKRTYGFQPPATNTLVNSTDTNGTSTSTWVVQSDPYRVDLLFADRATGALVAVHPKVMGGARTMATYNCHGLQFPNPLFCSLASSSPNKISTGDVPVDLAHNNLVDVYDFYIQQFGRHGIDGNDHKVVTLTHYGFWYNNAFFDSDNGNIFAFGDGDGFQFGNWAQFDVVAHEFSHGVTFFTSNLIYSYESGALNEAFSDVMGATADRLARGKSPADTWRIGEDVTLQDNEGIRNMGNPALFSDPDYYANRYTGFDDEGGVHTNSALMNKAFYLMVQGGTHPLSGVVVPPLSTDFDTSIKQAAIIFYNANTMCLTESSDYLAMRDCTLLFATTGSQASTVQKAWDAVGVKGYQSLAAGTKLTGITLPIDNDAQVFVLDRTVQPGQKVSCNLTGTNGDPDLSVRFGRAPNLYPNYNVNNDCYSASEGTVEACTTGEAVASNTKVYVAVEAYYASSNMQLLCTISGSAAPVPTRPPTLSPTRPPSRRPTRKPTRFPTRAPVVVARPPRPTCRTAGTRCTSRTQCCNASRAACDGTRASTRVCKACKARGSVCARSTQCCPGRTCQSGRCA